MSSSEAQLHRRSVILMLLSVILFAINVLIIRWLSLHALEVDGWMASLFRGAAGLAVVALLYGGGRGLDWRNLIGRPLIMVRGILGAAGIVAFYTTVVHLGAARSVVLNLTYPMFAAIIAAIWLREHLSIRAAGWLATGFLGLVVFLSDEAFEAGLSFYDLLALLAALAAGVVVVLIRLLRHTEHPATIYASQCVYSLAVASGPAAGALPGLTWLPLLALTITGVIVAFGQLYMTRAYQTISVSQGGAIQMLLPIVTAAGGFLFFGERFSALETAGAMITLFATWQVVRRRRSRGVLTPGPPGGN